MRESDILLAAAYVVWVTAKKKRRGDAKPDIAPVLDEKSVRALQLMRQAHDTVSEACKLLGSTARQRLSASSKGSELLVKLKNAVVATYKEPHLILTLTDESVVETPVPRPAAEYALDLVAVNRFTPDIEASVHAVFEAQKTEPELFAALDSPDMVTLPVDRLRNRLQCEPATDDAPAPVAAIELEPSRPRKRRCK